MSKIDVIVPCYQYGRFLRDSVASVLRQDVGDLRVLIIDNASTDDSVAIAREIAASDSRVSVIEHQSNVGQVASYNEGLAWVEADYFTIVDADDILPAGSLARGIKVMEADKDIAFCHGVELQTTFAAGQPPKEAELPIEADWTISSGPDFIRDLATNYKFVGATSVIRRTAAQRKAGKYIDGLEYAFDVNMWLRLAMVGRVAETDGLQGIRRIHSSQITETYRRDPVRDCIERLNNLSHFFSGAGASLPESRTLWRQTKRAVAISSFRSALDLYDRGDREKAHECVRFALSVCPSAIAPRIAVHAARGRVSLSGIVPVLTTALRGPRQYPQ